MNESTAWKTDVPIRRPKVLTLAKRIKAANPGLSEQECIVRAKAAMTLLVDRRGAL